MQTSALLAFKSAGSVKKALKTAAEGKSLQFQFSAPTENFGLKGRKVPLASHITGCVMIVVYSLPRCTCRLG